jgi:hypothetical protein
VDKNSLCLSSVTSFTLDDLAEDLTPIETIALSCVLIVVKALVSGGLKAGKVSPSILINTR